MPALPAAPAILAIWMGVRRQSPPRHCPRMDCRARPPLRFAWQTTSPPIDGERNRGGKARRPSSTPAKRAERWRARRARRSGFSTSTAVAAGAQSRTIRDQALYVRAKNHVANTTLTALKCSSYVLSRHKETTWTGTGNREKQGGAEAHSCHAHRHGRRHRMAGAPGDSLLSFRR